MRTCLSIGCDRETARRSDAPGYKARCGSCTQFMSRYNMTRPEVISMIDSQDFKCKICETEVTEPAIGISNSAAVDHCHTTGDVRGILCISCNTGLGKMKDDPDVLERAAKYLRGGL